MLIDPEDLELTILRRLVDYTGQRVVEAGAGDGRLAWPLARKAALWVALDPDPEEVAVAAEDLAGSPAGARVRLLLADGRNLPVVDGAFDLALFTWSLCCIPANDMALAVAEAHRILKPGGHLLDIHPQGAPLRLELWQARGPLWPAEGTVDDYDRLMLGNLAPEEMAEDFAAATRAIAGAARDGFVTDDTVEFDYRFFFETLDELTDYLEDNEELDLASDALLERTMSALQQTATPVQLVLVQPVIVTRLRKPS